MIYINLIAVFSLLIFLLCFVLMKNSYMNNKTIKVPKLTNQTIVLLIFSLAVVVRLLCAFNFQNHADLECFEYWGEVFFKDGFKKFYESSSSDYPPGYIYVLGLMTAIKNWLKIEHGSKIALFMLKIIPMACDLVTGAFLYKVATKRFNNVASYAILVIYLFNPGVILNSSVWGQVDSVFMLGILLMCYYAATKKNYLCYVFYTISILIKPQAVMFTPIIIMVFVQEIFVDTKSKKFLTFRSDVLAKHLAYIASIMLGFVLVCMPFGMTKVLSQYTKTMGSYKYASVNAYNFWSMVGLNWHTQDGSVFGVTYQQWGIIVILIICLIVGLMWLSRINDNTKYITIAIFICAAMFTFSVRMHERYLYPAIVLLLLLFVLNKHLNVIALYFAYSIAHFYNAAHVLYFYKPTDYNSREAAYIIIGLLHVIIFAFLFMYVYKNYLSVNCDIARNKRLDKIYNNEDIDKKEQISISKYIKDKFNRNEIQTSKVYEKFNKKDWIILIILVVVYSCFALFDLGDKDAPQQMWHSEKLGTTLGIELDKETDIKEIAFYNGYNESVQYVVNVYDKKDGKVTYASTSAKNESDDTEDNQSTTLEMNSVFCWDKWDINSKGKYIELILDSEKGTIGELVIVDSKDNIIKPKNINSKKLKGLFDEQEKYPKDFSFENSTYFDEIYHARTAYEFIHGITTYEWTHPPLGKIFIAIGIKLFGMCPFGWRIAGTIFGILMIPAIYVFAKRVFGKTYLSALTCILLTFDFMHFAQTRIATIDVYVTFFVILMYYFMYKYYEISFYDTKLIKTLVPLLFSGICMGLGIASKWTGCYAAVGLAIIFFYTIFKRYGEYKFALKDIKGCTNGIKHEHIVKVFKGNTIKTLLFCFIAFIGIPLIIYLLSYIPFIGGQDCPNSLMGKAIYNMEQMFNYHTNVEFEHGYSSKWYEWPLMIRPIFYYSGNWDYLTDTSRAISSFGNPLVWWMGIPAFIYVCYRLWNKKDRFAWFFFVGYLAQLMPWILVERLTFIYHYFPSVPFVVFMNVYMIYNLVKDKSKNMKYVYMYGAAVIILFVMFYPVLSGQRVSFNYVQNVLRWFESWVLIAK